MISIRVNDIKQYAYCPRIVLYQIVCPWRISRPGRWSREGSQKSRSITRKASESSASPAGRGE